MLRGASMKLYLHFKWFFRMLSSCFFYHTQSRALFCLQDKCVAWSMLENFGFHNEYEKVFIIFWTLQTNFCDSAHVGPCSKKVTESVKNEPDELKVITHLNIDKFLLNVPAVEVVVIRARFSSLCVVK